MFTIHFYLSFHIYHVVLLADLVQVDDGELRRRQVHCRFEERALKGTHYLCTLYHLKYRPKLSNLRQPSLPSSSVVFGDEATQLEAAAAGSAASVAVVVGVRKAPDAPLRRETLAPRVRGQPPPGESTEPSPSSSSSRGRTSRIRPRRGAPPSAKWPG